MQKKTADAGTRICTGGDGWKVTDVTWHGDPLSDACDLAPIWNNGYVIQQGPYTWP
jgi:hypothetical protein